MMLAFNLIKKFFVFSLLFFNFVVELYADEASSKGEIFARGCNFIEGEAAEGDTGAIVFKANFSSNVYKVDENLILFIIAEEKSYVTITDQGSDPNNMRENRLFEDVELLAGERKRFPPEGYNLSVRPPSGVNTFEIVMSRFKALAKNTEVDGDSKNIELKKSSNVAEKPTRCIMTFEVVD